MLFEQLLGALIFPKLRRPKPFNRKPGRAPTAAVETISLASQTHPRRRRMRYRLRPTLDAYHLRNRVKRLGPRLLRVAMAEHFLLRALTAAPLPAVVDAPGIAHIPKEPLLI